MLLLFPFHTSMIYNGFGENFYVKAPSVPVLNVFIIFCAPWFMPLMFALAGISASYALEKRTLAEYRNERILRLFIPLLTGLLLIVPVQTYFAERFHNGYTGGYFEQYVLFFTKTTDLSGYTGGFTPGHLWFILYLFIYSMLLILIVLVCRKLGRRQPLDRLSLDKLSIPALLPMFLIVSVLSPVLNLGGKSMGYFFAFFVLGFFVLSKESVQLRLEKSRFTLLACFLALTVVKFLFYNDGQIFPRIVLGLYNDLVSWTGILAFLALGRRYLNDSSAVTRYLAGASFPVYIIHQSVLVAVAFYTLKATSIVPLQVAGIIVISLIVTFAVYEVMRRLPVTRFLLGIKKPLRPEKKTPAPPSAL